MVALFDPKDAQHARCRSILKRIRELLRTTVPVLTEAFHMLRPESIASDRLRGFVGHGGLSIWFFDGASLTRAFDLLELYADHPMDLADASLVAAAETLGTRRVLTIDRTAFQTYRARHGHRHFTFEVLS